MVLYIILEDMGFFLIASFDNYFTHRSFEVDLEREPQTYILSPPGLNHTATFNATAVALMYSRSLSTVQRLSLQCGFINGDNTGTFYTRQFTNLYIQPGKKIMTLYICCYEVNEKK